jgi:predicted amidohydrolase YtcJ
MEFFPAQQLSREEALLGMTRWAAYACFLEQICGTLEAGRQADFVVLDSDLLSIDPKQIRSLPVWQTWVDGTLVYTQ